MHRTMYLLLYVCSLHFYTCYLWSCVLLYKLLMYNLTVKVRLCFQNIKNFIGTFTLRVIIFPIYTRNKNCIQQYVTY